MEAALVLLGRAGLEARATGLVSLGGAGGAGLATATGLELGGVATGPLGLAGPLTGDDLEAGLTVFEAAADGFSDFFEVGLMEAFLLALTIIYLRKS